MKSTSLVVVTLAGALAAFSVSAFAGTQDQSSAAPQTQQQTSEQGHGARQHDRMANALGLTDDQKAQMKQHHQQQMQAMQILKADTSRTPEQKKEKTKEMHQQSEQFMEGLLSPEQKTKWEQMKAQHKQHHKGDQTNSPQQG